MALPWYLSSVSIWFRFASDGVIVWSSRVCFTYFSVLVKSNSGPQKLRPRPMKARMVDSYIMENAKAIKPNVNRSPPTSLAGFVLRRAPRFLFRV